MPSASLQAAGHSPAAFPLPDPYFGLAGLRPAARAHESDLWLGPMRQTTHYAGALLYLFTVGCCYSMFTAVVLEFLGDSGKSGSTRYSIINSRGDIPVLYMLQVDG